WLTTSSISSRWGGRVGGHATYRGRNLDIFTSIIDAMGDGDGRWVMGDGRRAMGVRSGIDAHLISSPFFAHRPSPIAHHPSPSPITHRPSPMDILNLESLEPAARDRLEPSLYDYIAGGAADEWTLRESRAAWNRWQLVPRMLRGVATRAMSTTVLGTPV